jgi:hypothetical protein
MVDGPCSLVKVSAKLMPTDHVQRCRDSPVLAGGVHRRAHSRLIAPFLLNSICEVIEIVSSSPFIQLAALLILTWGKSS